MLKHLKTLPVSRHAFIWSDYIELLTLASEAKAFSKKEFVSLLSKEHECNCEHPLYTEEDAHVLWKSLIIHCENRCNFFCGHYPYKVDSAHEHITLNLVLTHPKQRLYLGTLIASCMHHLPDLWHDQIAQDFAQVCHQLFINLMPQGTQIQRLPASHNQFPAHEQIQYMARMVRGRVLCQGQDFDQSSDVALPSASQDAPKALSGIVDMLAWHPMGDERDGIPVAIARCDCDSTNWLGNQQTLLNLETQFYTRHPWASYHFCPIDLYSARKDWALKHQLGRVILLDRYRILNLAEEYFIYNDVPDIDHIEHLFKS